MVNTKPRKTIKLPENAKVFEEYLTECRSEGISQRRIDRYRDVITPLSNAIGKPFKEITEHDLRKYVTSMIESGNFSDWTMYTNQIIIKNCFFTWLYKAEKPDFPAVVKWMRPKVPNRNGKLPEDMISEDEALRLIQAADNPRDKAIVAFLFETGCRIGELMSLRIKNVHLEKELSHVVLSGKTGMRKIPVINSASYLAQWISQHPGGAPNDLVFINTGSKSHHNPMSYTLYHKLLKKLGEKAGVSKKLNPHNFRHSQATIMAGKLTEPQLRTFFGWSNDSKMVATYVHMSGRDLDNAVLEAHGLRKPDSEKGDRLKPRKCPRCFKLNGADVDVCSQCGMSLDLTAAVQRQHELEDMRKEMENIKATIRDLKLYQDRVKVRGLKPS